MFRALRVVAVLHALSLFVQPILAGLFLSGQDTMIDAHANNATIVVVLGLVQAVLGFLCWRKKTVSRQVFTQALAIWILEGAQIGIGYGHILWLHIPLGTLLLAGEAVLITRIMAPQTRIPAAAEAAE